MPLAMGRCSSVGHHHGSRRIANFEHEEEAHIVSHCRARLQINAWLLLALVLLLSWPANVLAMRPDRIALLRQETVEMFYHGYDNYMNIAFPEDELRPVSCTPLSRDAQNPNNVALNDVLGNYSLTLIDSLSTLAILASAPPDTRGTGSKALRDFQDGVAALVEQYGDGRPGPSGQGLRGRGFDVDSKVQVFETVIRGVGGLLSAHLFAIGELPITGYSPPQGSGGSLEDRPIHWPNGLRYDGQLLRLALDLAQRLLPAFYTATGMPYPRVNLRSGIPFYANSPLHEVYDSFVESDGAPEITETCSAGAGSLVLEFTVLSRLTGDARFEQLAKRAFWAVWSRKSQIGLIGAGVDAEHGQWIGSYSVIGAGADSFFEYALKTHILLSGHDLPNRTSYRTDIGEHWLDPNILFPPLSDAENSPETFLQAWHHAHAAVKRHLYTTKDHPHYINVNLWTGSFASNWVDSLGAFYAGLLTIAGEVEEAIETNLLYTAIWTKYAALPERWSLRDKGVEGGLGWWPLRPEFIESTYHIYRATKDPWYLYVGEMVLRDITRRCWTPCGWAGLQNVVDGEKSDRMESFFLGETAKYMYLLFDDEHPLNSLDAAYVFTTEGHPLIIPRRLGTPKKPVKTRFSVETQGKEIATYHDDEEDEFTTTCPLPPKPHPLTYSATAARLDIYHAARLLDLHMTPNYHVKATIDGPPASQLLSQSNHTLFPWTLPPELLPPDGTCAKVYSPVEMTLEFANTGGHTAGGSAFNFMLGSQHLERLSPDRIRVTSLSGLKMTFGFEEGEDPSWRLNKVNGVPLGRDEFVVMDRSILADVADQRFSLVRDPVIVKLQHLHRIDVSKDSNNTEDESTVDYRSDYVSDSESVAALAFKSLNDSVKHSTTSRVNELGSLVKSILKQVISSLDLQLPPAATPGPGETALPLELPYNLVINQTAVMPTGPGAAPLPAIEVPGGLHVPDFGPAPASVFPWTTVYAAGDACGPGPLPDETPRDHQVIVIRRGGCSFAEKLANIPAFVPDFRSLQLVVIVSDEEEVGPDYRGYTEVAGGRGHIVRPLLEEAQRTPKGVLRRNPIAMVMVGGGDLAYHQLAMADQVGVTRRYFVESQGVRVRNLIVDDGDAGENT
ncbi:glycoside hydrolase family 47 protein [Coniochaeta sp. 2T2.1]|nr:glycoside hydrolase family 47 protein [Coniochaeta sp. 2T2.1]